MNKPLLAAGALLLAGLGTVGAVYVAWSGSEEEVVQQAETATPTPSAIPSPSGSAAPSPSKSPTPVPSAPGPSDWPIYFDPDGRFTLRYPSGWFLQDGATSKIRAPGGLTSIFSSFQPGTVAEFPSSALKVDLEVFVPSVGNDCRMAPDGATVVPFGGVDGWQKITTELSTGEGRSVAVSAYSNGYCYRMIAYFGRENKDDAIFSRMIDSFEFIASGAQ